MVQNNRKNKGFTIVELLVVIVVIAILAAITIVSYTGITNRANDSRALSNADEIKKVADAFYAEAGYYPRLLTDFANGYSGSTSPIKKPASISVIAGQSGDNGAFTTPGTDPISGTNGITTISYACAAATSSTNCGTLTSGPTGARLEYWDYDNSGGAQRAIIYLGDANGTTTEYSITGL